MLKNRIVFDIEGDGLLDTIKNVHCIVLKNIDTTEKLSLYKESLTPTNFMNFIEKNPHDSIELIGHNIIKFDIPLLKMFYGIDLFNILGHDKIVDTLLWSKVLYPDRPMPKGCPLSVRNPVTNTLKKIGSHGLESWGYRCGQKKVEIHDWRYFNDDIIKRCEVDVDINEKVYKILLEEAGIKND